MAKKKVDGSADIMDIIAADNMLAQEETVAEPTPIPTPKYKEPDATRIYKSTAAEPIVSCLRKERVIARLIKRKSPMIVTDNHVLDGGMSRNSTRTYTVPRLQSGQFVKVLTDAEERFLENMMGLEPNTLSSYRQTNNYWSNNTPNAINSVTLQKDDNYFDLSIPEDYIKVKILLANTNLICPSLEDWRKMPKASYQYVLIRENEEVKNAKSEMDTIQRSYMEYGKYSTNIPVLRHIIETFEKKATAPTSKLEFLQIRINSIIQKSPTQFLDIVDDPYMLTKVLIRRAIEAGIIVKRGAHYYLRDGNLPLCGNNEEPTLAAAAKFLNLPKNQTIKFGIEQKLNE